MLPSILVSLIPILVEQAEKLMGEGAGAKKRDWVHSAVADLQPFIKRVAPEWATKNLDVLGGMVDTAIEFALDALEK